MSLASLFVGKFLSSEGSEKAIFRTTLVAPARFTIFATAPFRIIPPLLASNYKSQSIGPLSQWIMPRYLKTRRNEGRWDVRSSKGGGGRSPRRNRALAAGGYFRMQTDFEFTGRGKKFHGCTAERHSNLPARSPRPSFCFLSPPPKKKEILFRLLSSCR